MRMGKRGRRSAGGKVLRQGESNVFGEVARPLPSTQLPTSKDIGLQMLQYEQFEGLTHEEAVEKTAKEVEKIYSRASIPTIANQSIRRKIRKLMQLKREKEMVAVVDQRTGKVKDQGLKRRKKKNNKVKEKLQDIKENIFEVKTEVPELEKVFYEDQCEDRKMFIGEVDEEETENLNRESAKKKKKEERVIKEKEKLERMKEKEKEDRKKYKKVEWKDDEAEDYPGTVVGSELDYNQKEDDENFNYSERSTKSYRTSTGRKRKRMTGEEEEQVEDFLEACERFKVSENGGSTLFNLRDKNLKSNPQEKEEA